MVVIASRLIDTYEDDVPVAPCDVLRVRRALTCQSDRSLAEALVRSKKDCPKILQALLWIVEAVVVSMAVGPLVVSGKIDSGVCESVEEREIRRIYIRGRLGDPIRQQSRDGVRDRGVLARVAAHAPGTAPL